MTDDGRRSPPSSRTSWPPATSTSSPPRRVLFATGGFGKMFKISSNAHSLTGDGPGLLYRRGIPLEDMEFFQFHPTGIYKLGILLSEAARGEGGILRNTDGERFMERYAPTVKDLAPRDMVSRARCSPRSGRGGASGPTRTTSTSTSPTSRPSRSTPSCPTSPTSCAPTWASSRRPSPIPIQPTAHYAMGGIPTNIHGEVVVDADEHGRSRACTPRASARACRCTAPTGSARTRCSTSWCSVGAAGRPWPSSSTSVGYARRCRADADDDVREPTSSELKASTGTENGRRHPRGAAGRDDGQGVGVPHRGEPRSDDARHARASSRTATSASASTTRARSSTTTSPRPSSSATSSTWPRPGRSARGPAPRAAARTAARTIPLRDDANWMKHTLAYRDDDGTVQPRLQAGRLGQVRADGAEVLMAVTEVVHLDSDPGGRVSTGQALQPRGRHQAALAGVRGRGATDRPGARRAARGQVAPGRHADVPPLVRPRRLRLRRHGHQRRERAGVRALIEDVGTTITRRADPRPAGDQGPASSTWSRSSRSTGRCCRTSSTPTTRATGSGYQSPEDRERFDDTTKCILCAACTTSCPVYWGNSSYVGPAAIVNAHRFIFDSRDEAAGSASRSSTSAPACSRCRTDLQLHRRLPPRHQGHPGDRRGEASHPLRPGLNRSLKPTPAQRARRSWKRWGGASSRPSGRRLVPLRPAHAGGAGGGVKRQRARGKRPTRPSDDSSSSGAWWRGTT